MQKLFLKIGAVLFSMLIFSSSLYGQNFEEGLRFYQQKDYEQAIAAFNNAKSTEAYLFAGKSFYAMGRYQQAQSNLNLIPQDAAAAITQEALYTSALVQFQLKNFASSLNNLYRVIDNNDDPSLNLDAKQLYGQILNYLTAGQRLSALSEISFDEIKYDLFESALGKIDFNEAKELMREAKSSIEDEEWNKKIEATESELSGSSGYTQEYGRASGELSPPDGTIYNIGLALPQYQPDEQEFSIVKSIYFGALLAANEFNDNNRDAKTSVHFVNTGTSSDGLRPKIEQFSKNYQGDALIGPLFSQQAEPMIPISTDLKIPTIAPLANSKLNSDNSFLFQSNPTFAMHGRAMARYAVQELQMERFAVLARRGSLGASSAEAFRDEAEKLGAEIIHYFIEDMQPNEYEVSQYTKYFGANADPIDAVYAPFTGQSSLSLIDFLLADLRVMNNPPVILGSQEWQKLNYASSKYNQLDIYFSQGYYLDNKGMQLAQFNNNYRNAFNSQANQFAMIGYDTATFILNTLQRVKNPALLKTALLSSPQYYGLVSNIHFDDEQTNKAVKILTVSERGELIVRQ